MALGIDCKAVDGGVAWTGDLESVVRANLWLRTATRVLVRIAEFRAKAFYELEKHANRIQWRKYVVPNAAVEFRVTARKSKLYHTGAIAERLGTAVKGSVKNVTIADAGSDDDESSTTKRQMFVVRFVHDVATVSVDSSGALLHLRGYRQALAKAPMRETLAAATLLGAGWKGDEPLTDPMCGSGTIPIEAALIARRVAPGKNRSFAFLDWPGFDRAKWTTMLDEATAQELASSPVGIEGSDRDEGAIGSARANAKRAGVAGDVAFEVKPISAIESAEGPGLVAGNPPYGVRVGESEALKNFYAQLGNVLRAKRPGWRLALFSADKQLERQTKLSFDERFRTKNGGIPVHLVVAEITSSTTR
jgi:putative N6-adenine-specific DNA methylase